jgi:hypothetical protein
MYDLVKRGLKFEGLGDLETFILACSTGIEIRILQLRFIHELPTSNLVISSQELVLATLWCSQGKAVGLSMVHIWCPFAANAVKKTRQSFEECKNRSCIEPTNSFPPEPHR